MKNPHILSVQKCTKSTEWSATPWKDSSLSHRTLHTLPASCFSHMLHLCLGGQPRHHLPLQKCPKWHFLHCLKMSYLLNSCYLIFNPISHHQFDFFMSENGSYHLLITYTVADKIYTLSSILKCCYYQHFTGRLKEIKWVAQGCRDGK